LVDVFLPNEQEARAISGQADVALAGQNLTAQGPLVVIKRGHQGALAFQGSSQWEVPSNPIDPGAIADTIGAGDCFDAGFLRAWHAGWKIPDCLKLGVRCGESSLRAAGGYAAQLEEAIA
jgi:sugar/nucleoside kinase (ribokinase family)